MTTSLSTALNTPIEPSLAVVQELQSHADELQANLQHMRTLANDLDKINAGIQAALITATMDATPENAAIYLDHLQALEQVVTEKRKTLASVGQDTHQKWAASVQAYDRLKAEIVVCPGLQLLPPTTNAIEAHRQATVAYVHEIDGYLEKLSSFN